MKQTLRLAWQSCMTKRADGRNSQHWECRRPTSSSYWMSYEETYSSAQRDTGIIYYKDFTRLGIHGIRGSKPELKIEPQRDSSSCWRGKSYCKCHTSNQPTVLFILTRRQDRPICYMSQSLSSAEPGFFMLEREALTALSRPRNWLWTWGGPLFPSRGWMLWRFISIWGSTLIIIWTGERTLTPSAGRERVVSIFWETEVLQHLPAYAQDV